ncbi:FemAB-related protein, PEP-CTERM system-associated [Sphingomonas guangdongensis]|uniref:FemAB-related protein, PEP-CTERM system-associated n=1 Tax=Sphingomonas guangdongensis TaxID=1141890 RepID=A0A285R1H1_9SPHN|nr:FemAB family XrtA/PEP-CTERM system-associated protein [Sphingomonas guangdongensis]SOB87608.1 FemAB-related protein, PEP-CTERM system-associated [Sphingomonas guangdongensis]
MNAPLLERPVAVRQAGSDDDTAVAAYVEAHADGTPFHLPAWSAAVAEGCGQRSHFLVAERGDGAIAGVLPLTLVRSPLFGAALVSAGFGVGGGVLADDAGAARALAAAAWRFAEAEGVTSLELRGGASPDAAFHTDAVSYLGFVRPLAPDDEAQLAAIPRKQRAEVRRSFANDLTVTTGVTPLDRAAHYRVYAESVHNLGTPVFPRQLFAAVLDAFAGDADILTVRQGGVALASVISLYWRGTVYPYWGGGTAAARGARANDAMYYALMNHARARGCARFDFGRSKVGTGAAAFKRNWGFEGVPLAYHVRTEDGAAPRQVNPLDPRYARKIALWKRLPLPIATFLGPFIARGLG